MAGFSMPGRVQTSTLNAWLKQIEEPIYHENPLMAIMRKRGLIHYNAKAIGKTFNWNVKVFRRQIEKITGDQQENSFPATNTKVQATLPWCGHDIKEQIGWLEKKINANSETKLYDIKEDMLRELMEDYMDGLGLKMWQDGTIEGDSLYGVMSLYGASSTITADEAYNGIGTYTPIVPTDGTSPWWACNINRTYAGLVTALGEKVNSYTGNAAGSIAWPYGQFSTGYHYWHPIVGDYNSSYFTPTTGSTHSWNTQWQQSLNAVTTYHSKLHKVPIDMFIIDADLMVRAENSLLDKQRFTVSDSSEMRSLGFKTLEYNGLEMLPGYGVPDGMVCGFTFSKMEMLLLQNQLVEKEDDHDIYTSADLYKLSSGHQMKFASPAYFPALVPASAEG